ncbi:MAG: hypothetical protein PHG25_02510 [Candidatus Pacebacteria bacterium]|nr:hypothetical protein [Candidatus Paceibacterota bacterium]
MKFKHFLKSFQSEKYTHLLRYLSFAFAGLIIFGAGIYVGHRATDFSYQWGANYSREFSGPHSPFGGEIDDAPSMPHGAFGAVIGINFPSFAIKGPYEAEKIILISTSTLIRALRAEASTTDIHVGSAVIVIGEPDDHGRINATLIRIMPPPAGAMTGSSSNLKR